MRGLFGALRRVILPLILLGVAVSPWGVVAQNQNLIPAATALISPGCSGIDLEGVNILVTEVESPYRTDPEWSAITLNPNLAPNLQPPVILQGFVAPVASNETSQSQAPAEVAEEDMSWTHYTHDWTVNVVPDAPYQQLLSSWVRDPGGPYSTPLTQAPTQNGCPPNFIFNPAPGDPNPLDGSCTGCPTGEFLAALGCTSDSPEFCPDGSTGLLCAHTDMEVEWDSASLMDEGEGFQRALGAVPEFVWPAVGDRVWAVGRWIFDCGHPGLNGTSANVKFGTEIHPPRAMVTFRVNHPALDSFPVPRVSAPNFPYPQSYLPVTGEPVPGQAGPTNVAVTEADIFVSVNGGAANDFCTVVAVPCSNFGGHTGAILPVNDRNYVFDVYPPGTDYTKVTTNGNFVVNPPVADASLQWRLVDHFSELPAHACGGVDNSVCQTVTPVFCLLDDSTPPTPQDQSNISAECPVPQPVGNVPLVTSPGGPPGGSPCVVINCVATVPAHPTRLRVILPFAGAAANFFAKSVLLGWDDVPTGPLQTNPLPGPAVNLANGVGGINPCSLTPCGTPLVRTFQVRLHKFTILQQGETLDWRIFVNVGGQWRYMSRVFDADANGNNTCQPYAGAIECFTFDGTPFTVSVQDGAPIHVGVGGFLANGVENPGRALFMCRIYPGGCDPPTSFSILAQPFIDLAFYNDERIGTYEFDLVEPGYSAPTPFTTQAFDCPNHLTGSCQIQYLTEFSAQEVPGPAAPNSPNLAIGTPSFAGPGGTFFSAGTPFILVSGDPMTEGFQYRFHQQGGLLPTYPAVPDFSGPVHWAHADLPRVSFGTPNVAVYVGGANSGDGPYDFQYSAESFGNVLATRSTTTVILDTTPPVISISQPAATAYPHSAVLTLGYSVNDGSGSGVASVTPTIDGAATLPGNIGLQSGQPINLLTELALGTHTFSITASDNVNNTGASSVVFTIVVTAQSIEGDVTQFLQSGAIDNDGIANSLLAKLDSAAAKRASGNCNAAANIYSAFINDLQAQSGKHVTAAAAAIMIADAQYLIAHCP